MSNQAIRVAVARADLIICTVGYYLPRVLIAITVGVIFGKVVLKCLPRK